MSSMFHHPGQLIDALDWDSRESQSNVVPLLNDRGDPLSPQTEGVTRSLAARDDFVLFLFTLMNNKKTFLQTATLIEDILGAKKVGDKVSLQRHTLFVALNDVVKFER